MEVVRKLPNTVRGIEIAPTKRFATYFGPPLYKLYKLSKPRKRLSYIPTYKGIYLFKYIYFNIIIN